MDELTEFLVQMEIATQEESALCEIPRGSTDLVTPPVRHGPWRATTCSTVLRIWYDAGWIGLYFPDCPQEWNLMPAAWSARLIDGDVLTKPDAEDLLDHPERWLLGHADGHVAPYKTALGQTTAWDRWYDQARDTAQRLPLSADHSQV